MEAFSLLKYWRHNAATTNFGTTISALSSTRTAISTTTIVTAVSSPQETRTVAEAVNNDDDGPFFDLEFAVPEEEDDGNGELVENDDESDDDVESTTGSEEGGGERDFKLSLSSVTDDDSLTPVDDVFFNGTLVPIESSETNTNNLKQPQFPVSFLKSATKLRVFMLGLKKSNKSEIGAKTETNRSVTVSASVSPKQQQLQHESKFFTLKFKVEEVPIVSLFTRDSSKSASSNKLLQKHHSEESIVVSADQEKRFSKEVVQKYLKKVKPLYVRVSKRYGEKLKFPGQLNLNTAVKHNAPPPAVKTETEDNATPTEAPASKQGNIPAGVRVVRKHLVKSRSASSSVLATPAGGPILSSRRDDSLLQQQDGIQSAILHCKRSFNATRDSGNSVSLRCVSDTSSNENPTDS